MHNHLSQATAPGSSSVVNWLRPIKPTVFGEPIARTATRSPVTRFSLNRTSRPRKPKNSAGRNSPWKATRTSPAKLIHAIRLVQDTGRLCPTQTPKGRIAPLFVLGADCQDRVLISIYEGSPRVCGACAYILVPKSGQPGRHALGPKCWSRWICNDSHTVPEYCLSLPHSASMTETPQRTDSTKPGNAQDLSEV